MDLVIAALSGVGITFGLLLLVINTVSKKGDSKGMEKIHQCWDTANDLSKRKIEVLERIADQLEIANNIARHK